MQARLLTLIWEARRPLVQWFVFVFVAIASFQANSQIFSGISVSGSVILSSTQEDGAVELLVSAPKAQSISILVLQNSDSHRLSRSLVSPIVHEASNTYHLPTALIHAMIEVESNYDPLAISTKGAKGLMQLMPETAKRFGAVNSLDPRENILTGSRYLRWLMDYFNQDLTLAVAAYNAGEMAVVRAGYRIPRYSETQKYVPKVMTLYGKLVGKSNI
jgi:soluble lytic murein transglycosylase-like protein